MGNKLTLDIVCTTYQQARALHVHLGQRGFNAGVYSPSTNVWFCRVQCWEHTVNQGGDMFGEIKLAYADAQAWFVGGAR